MSEPARKLDAAHLRLVTDQIALRPGWKDALQRSGIKAYMTEAEKGAFDQLLAHANEDGEAWPFISTIMENEGLTRRPVQKALRRLADAPDAGGFGLVKRMPPGHGKRSSMTYVFQVAANESRGAPPDAGGRSQQRPGALRAAPLSEGTVKEQVNLEKGGGDDFEIWPGAKAGLFERYDVLTTLLDRLSSRRDAKRQIARHGLALCRAGIEHCNFLDSRGEIKTTWARTFCHWITKIRVVDERLALERKPPICETPDAEMPASSGGRESSDAALHRFIFTAIDDQVRRDLERQIVNAMPHVKPGHKSLPNLVARRFLEASA